MHNLGWLFVCFVVALVLEGGGRAEEAAGDEGAGFAWRRWLVSAVMLGQVYAGLFAVAVSLRYPFSHSRDVAALLRREHAADAPLIFEPDYVGSAVLAYLRRADDYDLEQRMRSSFVVWDRREFLDRHVPSREELLGATGGIGAPVLVTEVELTPEQQEQLGVRQLAAFPEAIADLDRYFVYR